MKKSRQFGLTMLVVLGGSLWIAMNLPSAQRPMVLHAAQGGLILLGFRAFWLVFRENAE